MASAKKTAANRANAQASSGPKTAQGKARVARNALRHGLSTLVASDPALSKEADALAREIAGDTENPRILETAQSLAEAQIEIARIRHVRYQLLSSYIEQPQPEELNGLKELDPRRSDDRRPADLGRAAYENRPL